MFNISYANCLILVTPVDGNWSDWFNWLECSVSCGEGIRTRKRTCTSPIPMGGEYCGGTPYEFEECNTDPCSDVTSKWVFLLVKEHIKIWKRWSLRYYAQSLCIDYFRFVLRPCGSTILFHILFWILHSFFIIFTWNIQSF